MSLKNTTETYGSVARTFHWLVAIMIIGLIIVGLVMTDMPNTPDKFRLFGLHKSFGITVLMLAGLRLLWRIDNTHPDLPYTMRAIEMRLAYFGHVLLYALMFAMPLSGWLMSSAAGFPVSVFGWFMLPDVVSPDKELRHTFTIIHEYLAWLLMGMIALHILASLLHHFYYKDNVLRRMIGW